jgi:hypothetical protein
MENIKSNEGCGGGSRGHLCNKVQGQEFYSDSTITSVSVKVG